MTMVHKGNLTFKTIRDVFKLYKVIQRNVTKQNCCKKEQEGIGNLLFG